MGLSRLLPRAEMIIVTTPALSAQKVAVRAADMARRSYLRVVGVIENRTSFTCDHGESYALFGEGGGAALAASIGCELIGRIPLESAVSAGSDQGDPVALAHEGPAGEAFRSVARHLATVAAPPLDPDACTALMA
jgi:ATP-binding protein involved in chromosome partitioning